VAFVTGSVERVLRLSAEAGGVLRAGSGVVSFGTSLTDFDVALDALRSDSSIATDDRPVIRMLDGREASLRVVLSVPVIGALGENGEQQVEYRDAGTILTVRAVPEFGDVIRLELRLEVSAVQGTGVLQNPNFASNIVETTVLVRENEPVFCRAFNRRRRCAIGSLSLARPGVERSRSRVEQHLLVTVY
jgi:type II secretory pathway component GspD/PulD (secretin)